MTSARATFQLKWKTSFKLKFPSSKSPLDIFHNTPDTRFPDSMKGHPKNEVQDGARWAGVHFPYVHTQSKTNVGMGEDIEMLQNRLLEKDEKIISICGESGIGKTTLARELFHSTVSIMYFERRAWVRVGANFQARDIAASILLQLESLDSNKISKEEIQAMEAIELMEWIYKVQEDKRCLVVLDDVRTVQDFDTIRFAFALTNGTGIVITTQLPEDEVPHLQKGFTYQMKLLSEENSWELFESQLESRDLDAIQKRKEEMGDINMKKSLRDCKDLPLAVIAFGGSVRGQSLGWFEKLDTIPEHRTNEPKPSIDVLSMSIEQLPRHLKICLFYLGHFPDDKSIPVEKLYLMWIADERIMLTMGDIGDKTVMDIAEGYLLALVQRRLVMVHKVDYTGVKKIKSCMLHDLIRKRCILQGRKEGFLLKRDLKVGNEHLLMPKITIQLDYNSAHLCSCISEHKHVQSFLFFASTDPSCPPHKSVVEVVDLKEFQYTRVLDLDGIDFLSRKFPKGVDQLVSLTSISIRGCHLEKLPSSFKRFMKLKLLDLRVKACCTLIIPSDIFRNMSSLLHLYFPVSFKSSSDEKMKIERLINLVVLENVHAGICNADDLKSLKNLQIFKGVADGNNEDVEKMMAFVQGNEKLRSSSLSIRNYENYSKKRSEIVEKLVKTRDSLHALDIQGHLGDLQRYVGCDDPNFNVGSVSNIISMVFNGSEFGMDSMPILGGFQKLRTLVLCNDAFIGTKLKFVKGNFPELACLKLSKLWSLNEFTVESGAMPCLSSLSIERCNKLLNLPEELVEMEIPTLKEVNIRQMSKEFLEALVNKTGNNAAKWRLVTFYNI